MFGVFGEETRRKKIYNQVQPRFIYSSTALVRVITGWTEVGSKDLCEGVCVLRESPLFFFSAAVAYETAKIEKNK